jgi:pimeloyl-ACP methyl ester carboxylesterase
MPWARSNSIRRNSNRSKLWNARFRTIRTIPRTFPFQHLFDNRAGLQELAKNHGRAWIIQGDKDTVLPVTMSETLSREYKDTVKLNVIPGGDHNDIFARGKKELYESMNLVRSLSRRDKSE